MVFISVASEHSYMVLMFRYHKLCHMGNQRWLYLLGVVAVNFLMFQSILVPLGNHKPRDDFINFPSVHSITKYSSLHNPLTVNDSNSREPSAITGVTKDVHISIVEDKNESLFLESTELKKNVMPILDKESKIDVSVKEEFKTKSRISTNYKLVDNKILDAETVDVHIQSPMLINLTNTSSSAGSSPQPNNLVTSVNDSTRGIIKGKKMRCEMPPKSRTLIQEMNQILARRRAKSRAMV